MNRIVQISGTIALVVALLTNQQVLASGVTGKYVSDISGKSDFNLFFGKKKYRKLELLLYQDDIWITGVDRKYETAISGYREGDQIIFEFARARFNDNNPVMGKWQINSDGTMAGKWKGETESGSYSGSGKWRLEKSGTLSSVADIITLTSMASFSDLMLDDGNGRELKYTDVVGKITPANFKQENLPMKTIKVKKLPDELAWLKAFDFNENKKIDQHEFCNAWLVKLAELKSGSNFSNFIVRANTTVSPKKAICVSAIQQKAVMAEILNLLQSSSSASASSASALMTHLAPDLADVEGGGGGDGGGGDGGGGGGGGGM